MVTMYLIIVPFQIFSWSAILMQRDSPDRKDQLEMNNRQMLQMFHKNLGDKLVALNDSVTVSIEQQQQYLHQMQAQMTSFLGTKVEVEISFVSAMS
jgi:hypothetical protein